jgi:hypothetical protein
MRRASFLRKKEGLGNREFVAKLEELSDSKNHDARWKQDDRTPSNSR